MKKISKSDLPINRNEHAEAAERAENAIRCTHFEVGTWVTWSEVIFGQRRRMRAEVVARPGNGWMIVRHEDQNHSDS